MRGFRVVADDDLAFPKPNKSQNFIPQVDSICVPTMTFTVGLLMLSLLLITAVLVATCTSLRLKGLAQYKTAKEIYPYYK